MNDDVIWREGAATDRAIELFRVGDAKTDADGQVIPRHPYSRSFGAVARHLQDLGWLSQSETVTISQERIPGQPTTVTVEIEVVDRHGEVWEQTGTVSSSEDVFCWHALATSRALLHYCRDDGEQMTRDEVIAMLEARRSAALEDAGLARA